MGGVPVQGDLRGHAAEAVAVKGRGFGAAVKHRWRGGVTERRCRYCLNWAPLKTHFVKTGDGVHFLAKCKPCYNMERTSRITDPKRRWKTREVKLVALC